MIVGDRVRRVSDHECVEPMGTIVATWLDSVSVEWDGEPEAYETILRAELMVMP